MPEKPNTARREAGRTGRPSPLPGSISGVQALDTTGIITRKARGGERLGSLPVKPNWRGTIKKDRAVRGVIHQSAEG